MFWLISSHKVLQFERVKVITLLWFSLSLSLTHAHTKLGYQFVSFMRNIRGNWIGTTDKYCLTKNLGKFLTKLYAMIDFKSFILLKICLTVIFHLSEFCQQHFQLQHLNLVSNANTTQMKCNVEKFTYARKIDMELSNTKNLVKFY